MTAETASWEPAMRRALALAAAAGAAGEVPVGAVVVHAGAIVAEAANAKEATHDPLGHAEIFALRAAARALGRWRLTGCTLVVTLEPCPMCAGAIVNSRVDRVVFGAYDRRVGAAGSLIDLVRHEALNHRALVVPEVLHDACAKVLSDFFAVRRAARKMGPMQQ